jgi:long-chain acyl-CoA synthetase
VGATFHLSAGRHRSSVGELVELASAFFERPPPRLIDPAVYGRVVHPLLLRASRDERHRRALRASEVFFPYFDSRVRFDDRRARAALHASGLAPSPLADYFERLVEFALAADWGRRPLPRTGVVVPFSRIRRPARGAAGGAGARRGARRGVALTR